MRTGDPCLIHAISTRAPEAGFTYLWLLFIIAVGSATLAALGQQWRTAIQRDRELELMSRAQQIADAIAQYRAHSAEGAPPLPQRLAELLDDRRSGVSRRHLRRLYTDPFTGEADWVLLTDDRGGIQGIHSAARMPALITRGLDGASQGVRRRVLLVSDRVFLAGDGHRGPTAHPPAPPDAASAPIAPLESGSSPIGLLQTPRFNEQ